MLKGAFSLIIGDTDVIPPLNHKVLRKYFRNPILISLIDNLPLVIYHQAFSVPAENTCPFKLLKKKDI